jgi:catechol 2,3-dioxygenase-like lactoylglutathione lyase family enzyme
MPTIERILETALYVDDLDRATAFYRDVMGLRVLDSSPRLVAVDAGQASILLLFKRGASRQGADLNAEGRIPTHDGNGPVHVAFAIRGEELPGWERHLTEHGIEIDSTTHWPRGGTSVYFRDPDGHLVEIATPGVWATY